MQSERTLPYQVVLAACLFWLAWLLAAAVVIGSAPSQPATEFVRAHLNAILAFLLLAALIVAFGFGAPWARIALAAFLGLAVVGWAGSALLGVRLVNPFGRQIRLCVLLGAAAVLLSFARECTPWFRNDRVA